MPIGLGLASSHAPSMFLDPSKWPVFYKDLVRDVPQPAASYEETIQVIQAYVKRIEHNFSIMSNTLEAYRPDALIIVGDDQAEVFSDALVPSMAVFLGDTIGGTTNMWALGEPLSENHVEFQCHTDLAARLLDGVMAEGFDLAYSKKLVPLGKPEGGLGHAFTRPGKALRLNELGIPIIPFFLNTYHPPLPSGARCFQLGQALRKVSDRFPERIAIYASGGLSHDPRGPRAGWVDQPLDRWVLKQISEGNNRALENLFSFDSDTMRGGTGEIRTWITVGGAFEQTKAHVIDYFPAFHAVTGLGFAYWQEGE